MWLLKYVCSLVVLDSQEILAEDYNVNLFLERVGKELKYREYKDF